MAAPGENLIFDGTCLWDSPMQIAKVGPCVDGLGHNAAEEISVARAAAGAAAVINVRVHAVVEPARIVA